MSKNASFRIGEHFCDFIQAQVKQGRDSSAQCLAGAELRLLEKQEAKQAALRAALIEGEQSSPSTPFDFEAFSKSWARQVQFVN